MSYILATPKIQSTPSFMKRRLPARHTLARHTIALTAALLLGACGLTPSRSPAPTETPPAAQAPAVSMATPAPTCPPQQPCPKCPVCPPAPDAAPPAAPAPSVGTLQPANWQDIPDWTRDSVAQAWPALRQSCPSLQRQPAWQAFCAAADALGDATTDELLRRLIEEQLTPWAVRNGDGSASGLITGYYEPLIKGSRTRSQRYAWPVHGVPADLLTVDFGELYPDLKHLRLRGRIVGNRVVPYWNRAELTARQENLPAPVLFWAADPVELFFLQVQGSGRIELPDGSHARIGYADQNGHPYQSIGRWLVAQGELSLDKASMDGIQEWARNHPRRLEELLNANPSYVFFREMPNNQAGPVGALGVSLTPTRSIAVDPRTIPLGAPVFLASTEPLSDRPLRRLVVAQDTGGAIKGGVRADFFWGFGPEAGRQAGRMRQQGQLWVLLPKGMSPK